METRLRILKEATLMFIKYGIRSITMDYIANELGVSKRTIYELFKDKDDLVSQAIEEGAKIHKQKCFMTIDQSDNVIEAIFKIGQLNNQTFGNMNPLFFEDLKKYHPSIYDRIHKQGEFRDYRLTGSLFERGLKEGVISDKVSIELVNLFIHKTIEIIHTDEMKVYSSDEILKSVFIPYLIGISTLKGRELIEKYFDTN